MSINLNDLDLTPEELQKKLESFEHDYEVNKQLQIMNRSAIRNYKKLMKVIQKSV